MAKLLKNQGAFTKQYKIPKSIAIILDGNRRYARKLGMQPWKGHEIGLGKLEQLFNWCMELGIQELTLYCFSTENFSRNKKEVRYLFNLFWKKFKEVQEGKGIFKEDVRVEVIGRMRMFPSKMQKAMKDAMKKTKNNKKMLVNFALAYGGRQEIVDAVNKALKSKSKIDENSILKNLYMGSEPEIVIRPGGEIRTSNFLMWQSAYSELIFLDKLWPEFTKKDLIKCIKEYNERERRFGK